MLLRSLQFAGITFLLAMAVAMAVAGIMKLTAWTLRKAANSATTGTAPKEKEPHSKS